MRGEMCKSGFTAFKTLPVPQPCYPTGWWSCTLAKKSGAFHFRKVDSRAKKFETLYYSADTHHAALQLPPFLDAALENERRHYPGPLCAPPAARGANNATSNATGNPSTSPDTFDISLQYL